MNIFEEHGLMLIAAEQGRQEFNREIVAMLRRWFARGAVALRRARRRASGQMIRY